ncbi:MAG TPA: terminase small subunit [Pseudomonas sp.]|uniref:terminase small subunit n=1 Tax=Pseudomonas sp. TaxID=306 RepID=UPI002EDA8C0E
MTIISKSEFAARRGWAKSYVSKLAKQDRLVLTHDGKVDLEATERLLTESADPSKAAVAARHEDARVERDVRTELSVAAEVPAVQPPSKGPDFQKARAHREYYLAQLAEAEFRKVQGNLVERESVNNAAFAAGRMVRDLMFGLSPQIAPELAVMTDPWEIEKHLTTAFRRVFTDACRMGTADLEHALIET